MQWGESVRWHPAVKDHRSTASGAETGRQPRGATA